MAACYTLRVVSDFASAHTLRDYPGQCSRMHGHNWKLEVEVRARALDGLGMAVDFKVVKLATKSLTDRLDHRYLNDISPFDVQNPTAENIAAWLFHGLARNLNNDQVAVAAVTLWETERACVRYTEDAAD